MRSNAVRIASAVALVTRDGEVIGTLVDSRARQRQRRAADRRAAAREDRQGPCGTHALGRSAIGRASTRIARCGESENAAAIVRPIRVRSSCDRTGRGASGRRDRWRCPTRDQSDPPAALRQLQRAIEKELAVGCGAVMAIAGEAAGPSTADCRSPRRNRHSMRWPLPSKNTSGRPAPKGRVTRGHLPRLVERRLQLSGGQCRRRSGRGRDPFTNDTAAGRGLARRRGAPHQRRRTIWPADRRGRRAPASRFFLSFT